MTHRRDAPQELFGAAGYSDGTFVISGQHVNNVAGEDTKHIGTLGMKAELPLGVTADADYKRLHANRAAFVNTPTQGEEANFGVNVPLPGRVQMYALAQYLRERNGVQMTQNHLTRNAYRAGLDWEAEGKVFVGTDVSYEVSRRTTEGWFGAVGGNVNPALSGFEHVAGMYNRQVNRTTGLHGRVNLPRGFTVKTSGSYTWAQVTTPLEMRPRTDPGFALSDITPGDVRIARGSVGLEYRPARYKQLTARASYRMDHWVDKFDPANNGRASYTQVGVSATF